VPAFVFHLGDVVDNVREGQYDDGQFYESFGSCDRPIF
jgi:hypothetical protein